jgi:hypothetical protein
MKQFTICISNCINILPKALTLSLTGFSKYVLGYNTNKISLEKLARPLEHIVTHPQFENPCCRPICLVAANDNTQQ